MTGTNYWLNNESSTRFDIASELKAKARTIRINLEQHKDLALDEPVVMWYSDAANSGVYGIGVVNSEPYWGYTDDCWLDPAEQDQWKLWVNVRVQWLEQPVLRSDLKNDPAFGNAEIIKMPRKTTYRLTREQYEIILDRAHREKQ